MGGRLLVGINVGTTSVKTVLFDADGVMLSQAGQEYSTQYPRAGWAVQNPDDRWHGACRTLKRVPAAGMPGAATGAQWGNVMLAAVASSVCRDFKAAVDA